MKTLRKNFVLALFLLFALAIAPAQAAELHVAVASNFTGAIKTIAGKFEQQFPHKVILAFGSTGKHYAQIRNGAPFDLFLAADEKRPLLLEQEGIAVSGSRFTYALGKLALWSPKPGFVDEGGLVLENETVQHIAIANPKLAPYGKAAQEVLESRSLWAKLGNKLVRGENIAQTYQFVISGNAELGFVAFSQISIPGKAIEGSYWDIPQNLYQPIAQQVVLLNDIEPAREFLKFLKSEAALSVIRSFGYDVP